MDSKNSTDVTRQWYASRLRFPLSLYYPSAWQEAARRRLAAVCDFDASQEAIEAYVSGGRRRSDLHCCTALPCVRYGRVEVIVTIAVNPGENSLLAAN